MKTRAKAANFKKEPKPNQQPSKLIKINDKTSFENAYLDFQKLLTFLTSLSLTQQDELLKNNKGIDSNIIITDNKEVDMIIHRVQATRLTHKKTFTFCNPKRYDLLLTLLKLAFDKFKKKTFADLTPTVVKYALDEVRKVDLLELDLTKPIDLMLVDKIIYIIDHVNVYKDRHFVMTFADILVQNRTNTLTFKKADEILFPSDLRGIIKKVFETDLFINGFKDIILQMSIQDDTYNYEFYGFKERVMEMSKDFFAKVYFTDIPGETGQTLGTSLILFNYQIIWTKHVLPISIRKAIILINSIHEFMHYFIRTDIKQLNVLEESARVKKGVDSGQALEEYFFGAKVHNVGLTDSVYMLKVDNWKKSKEDFLAGYLGSLDIRPDVNGEGPVVVAIRSIDEKRGCGTWKCVSKFDDTDVFDEEYDLENEESFSNNQSMEEEYIKEDKVYKGEDEGYNSQDAEVKDIYPKRKLSINHSDSFLFKDKPKIKWKTSLKKPKLQPDEIDCEQLTEIDFNNINFCEDNQKGKKFKEEKLLKSKRNR
jgi:hypothetical protein